VACHCFRFGLRHYAGPEKYHHTTGRSTDWREQISKPLLGKFPEGAASECGRAQAIVRRLTKKVHMTSVSPFVFIHHGANLCRYSIEEMKALTISALM